jgi:hypothetical protein
VSHRLKSAWLVALFLTVSVSARAEQDFYGIKMRNELWARNLALNIGPPADEQDLAEGSVLDASVFADAVLKNAGPSERMEFHVNVVNNSPQTISADYQYRDFFLHMKDGQKIPLIDHETEWGTAWIKPNASTTFNPSTGNLQVRNEDVRMIECSFDAGRARLFLFPASMKSVVDHLKNPKAPPPPVKKSSQPRAKKSTKSAKSAKSAPAPAPAAQKETGSGFHGLMHWLGFTGDRPGTKKSPSTAAEAAKASQSVKAVPVKPEPSSQGSSAAPSSSSAQSTLDKAIQNFKYVPSTGAEGASPASPGAAAAGRMAAHVIDYNKEYHFVTVNIGTRDGLRKEMTLSILRDGKTVAKARIRQLREGAAAAVVNAPYLNADIHSGDLVSVV